jgi:predicted DCC family thiol-disulfide oxidoreductase YuxK
MRLTPELTLYFDGYCPFCSAEMQRLRRWDTAGRLGFVDISTPNFDPAPLSVDLAALDRELHGMTAAGSLLVGIDSMLAAYTLVGRGWLVMPLRVPLLRPLLARFYLWFARNRYRFSHWMGYRPVSQCESGTCKPINPFFRGR